MTDIGMILGQVAILFIIMLVGVIARKTKILSDAGLGAMSQLALFVTVPCMVLVSFQSEFSQQLLLDMGHAVAWSLGVHIVMWLLGKKIFNRFALHQRKPLQFAAIFSNAAFMGYPVLQAIFGETGLLLGSMYTAIFNIFLWTVGMSIFSGSEKEDRKAAIKRVLLNPGTIATVLGLVMFVFSIKLPDMPLQALSMLGNMTTPLSMLIVGARLADVRIKEAFAGAGVYLACALRLVVIPLILMGLMKLCRVPPLAMGVVTIQAAMPIAANTARFAEMFGGDAPFASRLVFLSTLLSIITIPIFMLLVA